jgi:hypothetical protein
MAAAGVIAGAVFGWVMARAAGSYVPDVKMPGAVPLVLSALDAAGGRGRRVDAAGGARGAPRRDRGVAGGVTSWSSRAKRGIPNSADSWPGRGNRGEQARDPSSRTPRDDPGRFTAAGTSPALHWARRYIRHGQSRAGPCGRPQRGAGARDVGVPITAGGTSPAPTLETRNIRHGQCRGGPCGRPQRRFGRTRCWCSDYPGRGRASPLHWRRATSATADVGAALVAARNAGSGARDVGVPITPAGTSPAPTLGTPQPPPWPM